MKSFRRILFAAALCGLSLPAFGDPVDFQTNVLDPPTPSPSTYTVFTETSLSFTFQFTQCATAELPNGLTASGCFAGINDSGVTWTALDMSFPNTAVLNSQPVSCAPAPSNNIYSTSTCALSGNLYLLGFDAGAIPSYPVTPGDQFFITETGVDPALFPPGQVTATPSSSDMASAPEPGSVVLALTGVGLFGCLCRKEFV